MTLYRDEGVVLRLHKLGEADRIVTVLTRRTGKVRAVAKGVRRTSSRFGARLEPGSHIDAQFFLGKSLDIVTQVESIRPYGAQIVDDYPRHTAGAAILEAADRLSGEEREPSLRLYLLLIGALRSLAEKEKSPRLVLDAFLVRGMSVAGWEPALDSCARCDKPGRHRRYSVESGGTTCIACAVPRAVTVLAETPAYIEALLTGDWVEAEAAVPRVRREASGVLAAHMQWHLERSLRSLPYVEREAREAMDGTPAVEELAGRVPVDSADLAWPVTT
ncbi:DNA replication and repair protein RecO [Antricoccus suffuscus]|uniref:DNA repair protein RecO n=1 Tax=Antricoccus suffuscus TaxID=1629062 RepID=A0A2T0Z4W1_9ACTN|nr:DNA repair protein RecO [Antricoccus suffuscus]PRZ31380.1 DNA replication and repair protein RecO [Antricoccus suffuscus]